MGVFNSVVTGGDWSQKIWGDKDLTDCGLQGWKGEMTDRKHTCEAENVHPPISAQNKEKPKKSAIYKRELKQEVE